VFDHEALRRMAAEIVLPYQMVGAIARVASLGDWERLSKILTSKPVSKAVG
jgi:hypothetical protein